MVITRCKKVQAIQSLVCSYPGEGNGTPLQYSCLENPMDGGAWWAAVHGVSKSRTRLSDFTFTFHFHALEKEMATHSSVLAWRIPGTGSLVGCRLWGCTESDTTEATQQQQQQQQQHAVTHHQELSKQPAISTTHGYEKRRWFSRILYSLLLTSTLVIEYSSYQISYKPIDHFIQLSIGCAVWSY